MKILVISSTPWNTNNSFGNSFANIFDTMEDCTIANIYCSEGMDNDLVVSRAFQITAKRLAQNLLYPKIPTGRETNIEPIIGTGEEYSEADQKVLRFAKTRRWMVLFWARNFLWHIGRWNSPELKQFIEEFQPDVIFFPVYIMPYMNRIAIWIQEMLDIPMLGYIWDDNYTLRRFSFSPLYWMDRIVNRRMVKKAIDRCEILYVISDIQKQEYDRIFHKDCRILTKGIAFDLEKTGEKKSFLPLHMLFAGNIGYNRWKSLALIGQALQKLNADGPKIDLTIYTATPITAKMKKQLNIAGSIRVAGRIPYHKVAVKQAEADILVHVEATDIVYRWESHHGFSTKLVDYMASNRAILAYGLDDQASIHHLKKHDAALVATTQQELEEVLRKVIAEPDILQEYAEKAWKCGQEHHNLEGFHAMLKKDFEEVTSK
jgi:glycosyltransferase involved in cell wall biosynthesis